MKKKNTRKNIHKDDITANITLKNNLSLTKTIFVFFMIAVCTSIIVFLVHKPALNSKALTFDDAEYISYNSLVNNPSTYSIKRFISEIAKPSTVSGYYQPLSMISLMMDVYMGGNENNLYYFHRTSLILHILNSILIGLIIFILFRNVGVSLFIAILFGTHPMSVEVISWVGERKTPLSAFFVFLSILMYLKYIQKNNKKYFIFTHILFVLSLLAKPTGIFLPIALILVDIWPLKRIVTKNNNFVKLIFEKIPLLIISGIFSIITYISQSNSGATNSPINQTILDHIFRIFYVIMFYIKKMMFPIELTPHYPIPLPLSLENTKIIIGLLFTSLLIGVSIILAKKIPALITSFSVFLILIFPTLGIVGFSKTLGSDKYTYIPVLGLLIILGGSISHGINYISKNYEKKKKIIFSICIIISLIICAIYSNATKNYTKYWEDTGKLNNYMIGLTPEEGLLWSDLGVYMQSKGKLTEALECYQKAITLSDNKHSLSYMNYGTVLQKQRKLPESIEYFKKALAIDNKNTFIYYNIGISLEEMGKIDEAMEAYKKAIEINPNNAPIAYDSIGLILFKKGKVEESLSYFEKAIEQDANFKRAYANYEVALKSAGKLKESLEIHKKTLEQNGEQNNKYEYIGDLLKSQNKIDEAIENYKKGIEINSKNYEIYNKMGIAYMSQKMLDNAIDSYQKCLVINPNYKEVYFNLGSAFYEKGDLQKSAEVYKKGLELYSDFTDGYKSLGFILYKLGKKDEALIYYNKYLEQDKNNANVYKNIGVIYNEKGMLNEAKEAFGNSLRINPNQPELKSVLTAS